MLLLLVLGRVFFTALFVTCLFLGQGRKEDKEGSGPFGHWSSNHLGKMAKYKCTLSLMFFFHDFFPNFSRFPSFSICLGYVLYFFKTPIGFMVSTIFVGLGSTVENGATVFS